MRLMKNILLLTSILLIALVGCVDRDFDAPPVFEATDPNIPQDQLITIDELKELAIGEFTEVGLDAYIKGIVVADDQSGNFFKSLVLQDETGGITILLDDVELWNSFPVGRRLFIHLQDIWLGEFNGLPQIGFEPYLDDQGRRTMARIPAALISEVILRGEIPGEPAPKPRLINSLDDSDLNTLVMISDVEFNAGSALAPYADSQGARSINHILEDCNNNSMVVRSSGFASFADVETPGGNGSIVGIYGIFGSDRQILIRDTDDVMMEGARCDGTTLGPVEVDPSKIVSVKSILDRRISGSEVNIDADAFLEAVVVSSDETGNFFKTLVVQDETGGIAIIVNKTATYTDFPIGTVVYVSLKDLFISDFEGLPQLGYAPSSENVKRIPEGLVTTLIQPSGDTELVAAQTFKISELTDAQLNTFIELEDVQFDDESLGNVFAQEDGGFLINNILEDCDGNNIDVRTSTFASFGDELIPGGNGKVKAVLSTFRGTYQLTLNFATNTDLLAVRCDGTTGGGGQDDSFNVDFEGLTDFDNVELEGWMNVATQGDRVWIKRSFDGNGYAQITAFQDTNPMTETWLISPLINTAENNTLSFLSAMAFFRHNGLEVLYANNFSGDLNSADWQSVSARLATESDGENNFVESGNIDLTQYGSEITLAFKYSGTAGGNTTTFRLDDIVIE